jgi:type 1 glutamine amidotransferase
MHDRTGTPGSATAIDTLVVTGGHAFEAEPFFAVFDSYEGITWSATTEPTTGHDVVVFYDMPGIQFTHGDPPAELIAPTAEQRRVVAEIVDAGTGLVFLHHAIGSWPAWDAYARMVGGRFHYAPASFAGVELPDSGYRFDVTHTVEVLEPAHPVCAGLGSSFTLTDELYCFPALEEDVVPLMRTTFDTSDSSAFFSADHAIRGRRNDNDGWSHPPGTDLVAWAKSAGRSPVVYLQFGDGPQTYANPSFRLALHNAIRWAASADARAWAAERSQPPA